MKIDHFMILILMVSSLSCKHESMTINGSDPKMVYDETQSGSVPLDSCIDGKPDLAKLDDKIISLMNQIGWPMAGGKIYRIGSENEQNDSPNCLIDDMTTSESKLACVNTIDNSDRVNFILKHPYMITNLNCSTHEPDWVVNYLQHDYITGEGTKLEDQGCERKDSFSQDSVFSKYRANTSGVPICQFDPSVDYKRSGYDQGHLSPAQDYAGYSQSAIYDSNIGSNIAPQVGRNFNQLIWKNLEMKVRKYASQYPENLLVITGIIHTKNLNSCDVQRGEIGPNYLPVPDFYYKIIIKVSSLNLPSPVFLSYLMENRAHTRGNNCSSCLTSMGLNHSGTPYLGGQPCTRDDGLIDSHLVPLSIIEELSGYTFFTNKKNIDKTKFSSGWTSISLDADNATTRK